MQASFANRNKLATMVIQTQGKWREIEEACLLIFCIINKNATVKYINSIKIKPIIHKESLQNREKKLILNLINNNTTYTTYTTHIKTINGCNGL